MSSVSSDEREIKEVSNINSLLFKWKLYVNDVCNVLDMIHVWGELVGLLRWEFATDKAPMSPRPALAAYSGRPRKLICSYDKGKWRRAPPHQSSFVSTSVTIFQLSPSQFSRFLVDQSDRRWNIVQLTVICTVRTQFVKNTMFSGEQP